MQKVILTVFLVIFLAFIHACGGGGGGTSGGALPVIIDEAPYVVRTSPASGATDVSTASSVVIEFSEKMATASTESAFSITPRVNGSFSWDTSGIIMTFTPSSALSEGAYYQIVISTAAKDLGGKSMVEPYLSGFYTTGASADSPSKIVDLKISATESFGVVRFTWSAPSAGSSLAGRTVEKYVMKYRTGEPEEGDWDAAWNDSATWDMPSGFILPAPSSPGVTENATLDLSTLTQKTPGMNVYFAIRSYTGNKGSVASNQVCVKCPWELQIKIQRPNYSSPTDILKLGATAGATDGVDGAFDLVEVPSPPDGISVYSKPPSSSVTLQLDYRGEMRAGETRYYDFEVSSMRNELLVALFPSFVNTTPPTYDFYLIRVDENEVQETITGETIEIGVINGISRFRLKVVAP